jgi:hypothetical protein
MTQRKSRALETPKPMSLLQPTRIQLDSSSKPSNSRATTAPCAEEARRHPSHSSSEIRLVVATLSFSKNV